MLNRSHSWRWLFLGLWLLLPALKAQAQPYNFLVFSLGQGLPQSQVWCAMPDVQGYMWFGTQGGGLCRFDGARFETYTTADGLSSNYIYSLYQDAEQRIWIGTNKGLCCYDGRKFTAVPGSNAQVNAIAMGPDNSIWAGTNTGIKTISAPEKPLKSFTGKEFPSDENILCFYRQEAQLWVGTEKGLWRCAKVCEKMPVSTGRGVYSILPDDRGRLLLACWGQGIAIFDPATKKTEKTIADPLLDRPLCIYGLIQGKYWVGTQNHGIVLFDPDSKVLATIGEADGLPHIHIRAIVRDRSDGLWVASSGGGVARLLRQNFRHYTRADGLSGNRIYAVSEDAMGQIWISASQKGIQVLDSSGFHNRNLDSSFQNIKCKTICFDHHGRCWVGSEGKGISILDSSGIQCLDMEQGLPGNWIQKIVCDRQGTIWVATFSDGIASVKTAENGDFLITKYKLGDPYVSTLLLRDNDEIWYATQSGGIGRINKGHSDLYFNVNNGLPQTAIRALAFDRQGRLWVGCKGSGLYFAKIQEKDTRFEPAVLKKALSSGNIYLLLCDSAGQLWAGSENGVDKLVFDDSGSVLSQKHYGRSEGFLGIETCQDAAVCDRMGRMWFGTMNGLTCYTPGEEIAGGWAPELHFEHISLFYKNLIETPYAHWIDSMGGLKPGLELPFGQNHLSFSFRAVDLDHPEAIRYRWRLQGVESEWSPPAEVNAVSYAGLLPGVYTFEVQAVGADGLWCKPRRASFVILQPFWQKTWFRLSVLLAILSLIALAGALVVHRVKKREKARRETLEIQNHMLQLEQKALQLQMNPHFIFNALTSIQSLITEKDYLQARQEINQFARLMRSILNNSRKQLISLEEEVETLRQYLSIEQLCHPGKFEFDIKLLIDVEAEEIEIPPMLLQPFVENAVVHGVSHLLYPGRIEVEFGLDNELLLCTITDNGVGREQAARLREEKKPGHQSVAMDVTSERLEALRSGRSYTALEIHDVTDASGQPAGTRVIIRLPYMD